MKIVGEVFSEEELYLEGDLEGKLELRNRLTIGPNSKVNASIKAKEVVVFGTVKGNVESETRVSLRTGASIVGDIKTAGIVIEDGAYFKGGIDISRGGSDISKGETATAAVGQAVKASGASAGQKR
jgi:cytoskeletal protein CcmA (bactofilin family)